jgi:hypothetical protein
MFERGFWWGVGVAGVGLALLAASPALERQSRAEGGLLVAGGVLLCGSLLGLPHGLRWGGQNSRRLVLLCAAVCLCGLALLGSLFLLRDHPRWAPVAGIPGCYLALGAIFGVCPVVSRKVQVLAWAGGILIFVGGLGLYIFWSAWPLYSTTAAEPQEIRLADLLANGPGGNRHVRVTGCRFCPEGVVAEEKPAKGTPGKIVVLKWFALVPAEEAPRQGPPPVPRRVRAVASETFIRDDPATVKPAAVRIDQGALDRLHLAYREKNGVQGIVNGARQALSAETREKLAALAPDTDFDELLVLEERLPPDGARLRQILGWGVGLSAAGFLGLAAFFVLGWRTADAPVVAAVPPEAKTITAD